jgi:hypothetical protein
MKRDSQKTNRSVVEKSKPFIINHFIMMTKKNLFVSKKEMISCLTFLKVDQRKINK